MIASFGETVARFICPDAPAQVTATWREEGIKDCPWCHRPLTDHDHYLWCITTGTSNQETREGE